MKAPPVPESRRQDTATQHAIRLEHQLVRVRWFGVAFGVFQVLNYRLGPNDPGQALHANPGFLRPANFAVLAGFGAVNAIVALTLRRSAEPGTVARLGHLVFGADILLLLGISWIYAFDRFETTWVLLFILSLEGALRFRLRGALLPVLLAFPSELARDLFRHEHYGYAFFLSSVTYRVGVMAIIAAVAGIMSRALAREREQAEALAARESAALAELRAFHDVVLAGVVGGSFEATMRGIVDAMARTLGYEIFAIGLVEVGPDGPRLRCVGAHGHPAASLGRTLAFGRGVCGRVAESATPQLIGDTKREDNYAEWVPGVRAEVCVPIVDGHRTLGIIDVESFEPDHFSQEDLDRLQRLAPQIGLVISNARLLAQERTTVSRLRELDGMKDDFIAITSHELRSPLTSIRGFVRTLRHHKTTLDEPQREEYLAVIDRQTERLSRLVEDLLVASRIERGTLSIVKEPVDVPSALRDVCPELGREATRIHISVPADLPPLFTDSHRFGQIARNLIENALKFSPQSKPVDVSVSVESERLLLDVRDHGDGIPRELLDRIFERFYQVGGSMGRRARGVGLGLYITKWLVEALGGSISVASEPGRGTTFRVSFPLQAVTRESRSDAIA